MKTKHPRKHRLTFPFATCTALLLSAQAMYAATVVLEDFDDLGSKDGSIVGQATGLHWPAGASYTATGTPPTYDSGIDLRYYLNGYSNGVDHGGGVTTGNQNSMSGSIFNNDSSALSGANYLKRTFSSTSFTSATTIWMSALVSYSVANPSTAAFLMFNNVGLRLGMQGGKLAISDSSGNIVASSTSTFATKQTHLIVFSLAFNPSGNEVVQGWIDPASATSLGTADVSYTGALIGSTLSGDVEFSLRGTASGEYVSMDAVRIAYGSGASLSNVMTGL